VEGRFPPGDNSHDQETLVGTPPGRARPDVGRSGRLSDVRPRDGANFTLAALSRSSTAVFPAFATFPAAAGVGIDRASQRRRTSRYAGGCSGRSTATRARRPHERARESAARWWSGSSASAMMPDFMLTARGSLEKSSPRWCPPGADTTWLARASRPASAGGVRTLQMLTQPGSLQRAALRPVPLRIRSPNLEWQGSSQYLLVVWSRHAQRPDL